LVVYYELEVLNRRTVSLIHKIEQIKCLLHP